MKTETRQIVEKLEEIAVFLRPLNYFWHKTLKSLALEMREAGICESAWIEKVSSALYGRNQLSALFVSPPREREQFQVLRAQLAETLEALKKKEV